VDEIPILAVAAACADGLTEIRGAADLRVKESDRLAAMAAGLSALGVMWRSAPTGSRSTARAWERFREATSRACGDHRVAMSFLVAGLCARAPVRVHGTRWIGTSDPAFLENLEHLAPGSVSAGREA